MSLNNTIYWKKFSLYKKLDNIHVNKKKAWDFPSGPVVKTSPSNAGCTGSVPSQGAKSPHALWPKSQNKSSTVTGSIKTLKNYPHFFKKRKKNHLEFHLSTENSTILVPVVRLEVVGCDCVWGLLCRNRLTKHTLVCSALMFEHVDAFVVQYYVQIREINIIY